jgi:hypothetical protein
VHNLHIRQYLGAWPVGRFVFAVDRWPLLYPLELVNVLASAVFPDIADDFKARVQRRRAPLVLLSSDFFLRRLQRILFLDLDEDRKS